MKCFLCGAECVTHVGQRVALDVELDNVFADGVTVHRCSDEGCGEELVELPNVTGLLAELALVVAGRAGRLTPKEVRFLRKHLGWSGRDFARAFRVRPETVSRWESGAREMDSFKEHMLRLLAVRGPVLDDYGFDMQDQDAAPPPQVYVIDARKVAAAVDPAGGDSASAPRRVRTA